MSLNILQVVPGLDPMSGGVVAAVNGLARALFSNGVNIEILATYRGSEDQSISKELQTQGISITRVGPAYTPLGWHPNLKSNAYKAVQRADIVHINGIWEDVQHHAARAAQKLNKPYIISPHGMLDPWSLSQSPLRKKLYLTLRLRNNLNRATALHFTAQAEHGLTATLKLKAPAIIEPNGLDLSEFETLPPTGTFRSEHPELGDRPYVLFLSRIHPKKGLDLLIPAFAQAAPPDYALVIAGPGEPDYVESIRQLAQQHGLANRALFPGMLSGQDKLAAYAEAELFALPSYQENFGIVIIEALACGTAVLISDKVNIHNEITKEAVGIVTTTEVSSVTKALREFFSSNSYSIRSATSRSNFAKKHYDWRLIASRWVQTLEQLAQNQV